jgi:hypothetical protein
MGLARLPTFIVADYLRSGRLRRILPEWTLPSIAVYAVYPHTRTLPAKTRRLIDFLVDRLGRSLIGIAICRERFSPPSKGDFFSRPLREPALFPSKGRVGWDGFGSVFGVFARTDSRPCGLSAIHGRQLPSFACPKESNQKKRHPRIRAARGAAVRYGRTGSAHRPSMACCPNRRDPSRRPRFARLFRPPSAATQREPEEQSERKKEKKPTCRIYPVLLRQGLPRSALPGFPLGRGEQAQEIAACPARGRAQDARASDLGTRMCRERTRSQPGACRAWMPGNPRTRGRVLLLSLAEQ